MKQLLTLMDLNSASGHEHVVRSYLLKEIRKITKNVTVDRFGNIIVHKKGKSPSVMFVAHMDEVGLIIQRVLQSGLIEILPLGGIDPLFCLNQRVLITGNGGKKVRGVVTTGTLSDGGSMNHLPGKNELIVDTGLGAKELKQFGIGLGSFIEFEQKSTFLGSTDILTGKAADDRVGCYVLLKVLEKTKTFPGDAYFVFTVQEEMGLYGARTSVYNLNPEWALVLDVTNSDDWGHVISERQCALGGGPVLTIKDSAQLTNECLDGTIKAVAHNKKIPLQLQVTEEGMTDALDISLAKGGIPTTVIGVATRNIHSGISIVHRRDIEQCITLVTELLRHPPRICL